ncbi:outer membrane receptor for ferrienterochelin and colicins [Soonwooa buanensis]|uniref:Outer membrane receptor for ferrienterochelin and colicins n=1 Tax=Soonwooa buanensis TaxID=619805 RepID=A0A1T5EQE9_9FLAO|nr:TonB-dependent receptor [Soonwooa buanensis]SKB86136.1 outer membrane receptor for ferrienterochelin and colicins [Soonwooa buanensis]
MTKTYLILSLSLSAFSYSQELDSLQIDSDTLAVGPTFNSKKIEGVNIIKHQRPQKKTNSIIPIEVYSSAFLRKSNTNNIFDSVAMINGVKPQLNCSVCNTGDIHINGMEGPYTLMLIDGMPIVSSLSTVYGLSGIPSNLVERIEVIKGPADATYGAEAMGGIINVITKNPLTSPKLSLDYSSSSDAELNLDLATSFKINPKISSLLSLNHFYFGNRIDLNKDNFTDTPLQHRISVFNKWNFKRNKNKKASLGLRYYYEDRFGGELNWDKTHRGSDQIYGESIYTNRVEAFALYDLPTSENITTLWSYNYHHQDSYYGDTSFLAEQQVFFGQIQWLKRLGKHQLTSGITTKLTSYDDNTVATETNLATSSLQNRNLYGAFLQDEWQVSKSNALLLAYRLDYDNQHGAIHSPRLAWKFNPNENHTFRASFGKGFRVVHVFTEDHAALTGSRDVVISEDLKPEESYNAFANYLTKIPIGDSKINIDLSGFYSYFTNKIIGDFDTDPDKIIFENLDGHAISKGLSLNMDLLWSSPLKINLGLTYMDVYQKSDNEKIQQLHAPKWSGIYNLSYYFPNNWIADFTGQFYGPMRLPILENDFRPEYSPFFTLANIQVRKQFKHFEIYAGVKNLLNFRPKNPIMRPNDPFDQQIDDTANNPNHYTFDTTYGYAPMQGIRSFIGVKWELKSKKF